MRSLKVVMLFTALILFSACAPRVAVKPIPADTPPEKVLEMVRSQDAGIKGLRASVKVTVQAKGEASQSFDGVLYAARPDRVRLTGLAMLGMTVFDVVLTHEKFYFYQPSDGYLYTGPREALRRFLDGRGVNADPEVIYKTLFSGAAGEGEKYLIEKAEDGYDVYLVSGKDCLTPRVKEEYDPGLTLKRKYFYDETARPYLYVEAEGSIEEGGFRLPGKLTARDVNDGYTVTVTFEKYLVNPDGLDDDFAITGGEFKGILEVE